MDKAVQVVRVRLDVQQCARRHAVAQRGADSLERARMRRSAPQPLDKVEPLARLLGDILLERLRKAPVALRLEQEHKQRAG